MSELIYLDHAATSSPKPAAVTQRIQEYFATGTFSAGRGSYLPAEKLGREIAAARAALAVLIGAESPDRITFTHSGTEALNLVLQGMLRPGDHVVTTVLEHNSVLRPLMWKQQQLGIEISYVTPDEQGLIDPQEIWQEMRATTRLICCVHASNVLGTIQPVREICHVAHMGGIPTLIDAAQTVGHMPVDVEEIGCDLLAAPAHKGLLAPLGTGFLYLRQGMETDVEPLLRGGTGSQSESDEQPQEVPGRYESGSLNVPGLLGLAAALDVVSPKFVVAEAERERALTAQLLKGLQEISELTVHAAAAPLEQRLGVVSVSVAGQDPRIIGTILDSHYGIAVRTGFHCAPRTHQWLGTAEAGGTVRLSVGHSTTAAEVDAVVSALCEICQSLV